MAAEPQVERLLGWIEEVGTPLVQLWGWPGSGRSVLAGALLERGAQGLAAADVADPARFAAALGASSASWLISPAPPPGAADEVGERLRALAAELPAGRRLLVVTPRRLTVGEPACAVVGPERLALLPEEVAALWRRVAGSVPRAPVVERLTAGADGWYRPLRLAARRAAEAGEGAAGFADALVEPTVEATAAAIAALPRVDQFLRDEVLGGLQPSERAALSAFAAGGAPSAALEERGWLLADVAGESRPPHLVTAVARRSAVAALARTVAGRRAATTAAEPRVRLHLLGAPKAERRSPDGWSPLHWPLRRAFLTLAYLASTPDGRATREELVEALWPEADDATVRRNFHPTLSHLRRGLRGDPAAAEETVAPLELADGIYRLHPEYGWWIDLAAFENAVERGRRLAVAGRSEAAAAAYEEAWRLHGGGFLEGWYEPWVARRREAVQGRFLDLLRDLGGLYERLGHPEAALDAYRALLARDPLQERIHTAVMRLYAGAGRRDLVRLQYRRLGALLREELGVEPLPETTDEYHRLMR